MTPEEWRRKLKDEGCEVDLQVWEDMVHVWQGYAPFLPEAVEALEAIGSFVNGDKEQTRRTR